MRAPRFLLAATLASLAAGVPSLSAQIAVNPSSPVPTSVLFTIPSTTNAQLTALASIELVLRPLTESLAASRDELTLASVAHPRSDSAIRAAAEKVAAADLALANTHRRTFAELQSSPNRLDPDQAKAFISLVTNPTTLSAINLQRSAALRSLLEDRARAEHKARELKAELDRQRALTAPPPGN